MKTRPTLHDVARDAGVSKSTVSRVINSHPHVGAQARDSVMQAMQRLGYERNEVARSLRTNATMAVGLLVIELRNEVFAAIAQGVERVLVDADRTLVIAASGGSVEREARAIKEFQRRGIDGLITSLADERARETVDQLGQLRAPIVLLDRDGKGIAADRVLTDQRPGVDDAVADLQRNGHTRIGLISPPEYIRPGRELRAAFTNAAGKDQPQRLGPLTEEFGHDAALSLISAPSRPTALVVAGTQVLVGVLTALEEKGLRVPSDLSLISFDDSAAARFYNPPISTLVRDTERIGELAARLVLERVDGGRTSLKKLFIPTVYEPRRSVAPVGARRARARDKTAA